MLLAEVKKLLDPQAGQVLVDGTVGAAGHARELASLVLPGGRVLGLDRDHDMLALAREVAHDKPITLFHKPYDALGSVLEELGLSAVDGILLDLGLSSDQLHWSDRGFSFQSEGPLDMRFDREDESTAADLVNRLSTEDLANVLYQLGEERASRRIARFIVAERKRQRIETTTALRDIVHRALGRSPKGGIDSATRTFQALRIAVNRELDRLDAFLERAPDWLRPGGKLAIISFHSLEDRRVKWAFRQDPRWTILTRKPVEADDDERARNPRARSAKLRVAVRCPIDLTITSRDPTNQPQARS